MFTITVDYGFPLWDDGTRHVVLSTAPNMIMAKHATDVYCGQVAKEIKQIKEVLKRLEVTNIMIKMICDSPLPQRNRVGINWQTNERNIFTRNYAEFNVNRYNGNFNITANVFDQDTQDEKDMIMESVLQACHKMFGCIWHRKMHDGYTAFSTEDFDFMGYTQQINFTIWGDMGCKIEKVAEINETPSDSGLKIDESGNIVVDKEQYIVIDGKIMRREIRNKVTCDAEDEE